ncbi:MAG: hypothetical protein AAFZ17_07545 [Cyanobacteria bacterium J06650_10]
MKKGKREYEKEEKEEESGNIKKASSSTQQEMNWLMGYVVQSYTVKI